MRHSRAAQSPASRYRIDLLFLAELIEDDARVTEACVEIFKVRTTHRRPPTLTLEPGWPKVCVGLAAEIDFPIADVGEAATRVQALIDRIDAA